jgi:hypothetical protein
MSDTFPKTAAGIQHAQVNFVTGRKSKLQMFTAEVMLEYDSAGLPPKDI